MPDPLDKKPPREDGIDTRLVRKLADILKDTGLSEIEVARGDLHIRVARTLTVTAQPVHFAPQPQSVATAPAATLSTEALPAEAAAPTASVGEAVKSPMVGTAYLQPQPGAAIFIRPGDTVTEGQTLMLVEAMKTMNPIPAPRAGKVLQVLVSDAQPVEYGQPLVMLE